MESRVPWQLGIINDSKVHADHVENMDTMQLTILTKKILKRETVMQETTTIAWITLDSGSSKNVFIVAKLVLGLKTIMRRKLMMRKSIQQLMKNKTMSKLNSHLTMLVTIMIKYTCLMVKPFLLLPRTCRFVILKHPATSITIMMVSLM